MNYQKSGSVVEQAPKSDSEGSLQELAVLRLEQFLEGEVGVLLGQERAPSQLALELLTIL